ncbi:hypothetical protein ABZ693_29980, partial [Streptomyces laurentii]
MATKKSSSDDLLAPVTLAVGQEDLLLDRAVREVVAAAPPISNRPDSPTRASLGIAMYGHSSL